MDNFSIVTWQHQLTLPCMPRGFHCIDKQINIVLNDMPYISIGILHLFLQHTSASLVLTENCCKDVKFDLEVFYKQLAPDSTKDYHHNMEGPDDMPAHIKNTLLGVNLTLPIQKGSLALGTWQGIYLGEHRLQAGPRRILITAYGQSVAVD